MPCHRVTQPGDAPVGCVVGSPLLIEAIRRVAVEVFVQTAGCMETLAYGFANYT